MGSVLSPDVKENVAVSLDEELNELLKKSKDEDDGEKYKHYVSKSEVDKSLLSNNKTVKALCGKIIKLIKNNNKSICPKCEAIYKLMT